jgi:hypothetical protein
MAMTVIASPIQSFGLHEEGVRQADDAHDPSNDGPWVHDEDVPREVFAARADELGQPASVHERDVAQVHDQHASRSACGKRESVPEGGGAR